MGPGSVPLRQMSHLPLPERLPERKHVLAAVFGLLGLGLMVMAVLTASGLASPFNGGDPESVRTGAVLVSEPSTTTTTVAGTAVVAGPARALAPAAFSAPTTTPSPTTAAPRRGGTTTTTAPIVPPTTVPPTTIPLLGGIGNSLSGGG